MSFLLQQNRQNRPKSTSKHRQSRNYSKISQANLDPSSIQSYLRSHSLNKTLAVFLAESQYMAKLTPILQTFRRGSSQYDGQISKYAQMIKSLIDRSELKNKHNLTNDQIENKWKKVELCLYIWHCINLSDKKIIPQRLTLLKQYITTKGSSLSEIPQLLQYFALPYTPNPETHKTLSKIFTKEWHCQLQNSIEQLITGENNVKQNMMQQEWLNIIKDMIEINEELFKCVDVKKNNGIAEMTERVRMYKTVIEGNEILKNSREQRVKNHKENKLEDKFDISIAVDNLKKDILSISPQTIINIQNAQKYTQSAVFSKIYQNFTQIYNSSVSLKKDKDLINQMIVKDILLINQINNMKFTMEWLKIVQIMSSYYHFRTYIFEKGNALMEMVDLLEGNKGMKSEMQSQSVLLCLSIIQKLIVRREIFNVFNWNNKYIQVLISLINRSDKKTHNNDKRSAKLLQIALSNILHLVIHRTGRKNFNKTIFITSVVSILLNLDNQLQEQLACQTLICSIIYLLLIEKEVRSIVKSLSLKQILLDRFKQNSSAMYKEIVQYIILRMENDEEIQDIQTDQDEEEEKEYDTNLISISVNQENMLAQRQAYDQNKYYDATTQIKQNINMEKNKIQLDGYKGAKYSRKTDKRKLH